MKKLSSILLICILAILFGCTKDNPTPNPNNGGNSSETTNIPPTCSITSPHEGDSFTENAQVIVNVVAEDSDGSISVVYLYIDNVGYQEQTSFPYNFTIAGGYFTEGSHTLKAVAKDNGGARAEASVTITISGPGGGTNGVYQIGDYYNRNGVEGVVYRISNGGVHGMIISLDEGYEAWSTEEITTGANDQYDGAANTNLIISSYDLNNYPAFKWCNNKNIDGITGWYSPSISEIRDILRNTDILNQSLLNNGGVAIINGLGYYYWSSTELSYGWAYNTDEWAYKNTHYKVRAVHSF